MPHGSQSHWPATPPARRTRPVAAAHAALVGRLVWDSAPQPQLVRQSRGGRIAVIMADDLSFKPGPGKTLLAAAERTLSSFDAQPARRRDTDQIRSDQSAPQPPDHVVVGWRASTAVAIGVLLGAAPAWLAARQAATAGPRHERGVVSTGIVKTVRAGLLHLPALEAAVDRAAGWLGAGRHPGARDAMKRDLASIDRELANLTAATATAGGDVQALVSAMREREARRRALSDQLAQISVGVEFDPKAVLAELQGRLNDWRELLGADVPRARGLLKQLIVGRVMMEPDRDCGCYRFHGTGTFLPLLDGIIPAVLSTERSVLNRSRQRCIRFRLPLAS